MGGHVRVDVPPTEKFFSKIHHELPQRTFNAWKLQKRVIESLSFFMMWQDIAHNSHETDAMTGSVL